MASSKDFEQLWQNYQEERKSKEISIVDYMQRNGVVYGQFERWYKKHVDAVSIHPIPSSLVHEESFPSIPPSASSRASVQYVHIEFSNGLKVCQKSLDYLHLKLLVEKLEALC